jgi:hypothetical protein
MLGTFGRPQPEQALAAQEADKGASAVTSPLLMRVIGCRRYGLNEP